MRVFHRGKISRTDSCKLITLIIISLLTIFASSVTASARDAASAAIAAADAKKYQQAYAYANKSRNPLAKKLVEWKYLRDKPKQAGYQRLINFARANPSWPFSRTLRIYAERRLLWGNAPIQTIARHFSTEKPASLAGYVAYAKLELARGNKQAARRWVLKAWLNTKLSPNTRNIILSKMRFLLTSKDMETRLWKLVHDQQTNEAVRTAKLISRRHVQAAKAAQLLIRRKSSGIAAYRRLPAVMKNKLALKYALARYYRRKKQTVTALRYLLQVPTRVSATYNQSAWWVEKRLVIRALLSPGYRKHWPSLYRLASRHGFKTGKNFEEGEFLAGWLALRKLGNAKTAVNHFLKLASRAKSRTQRARGDYWAARAYLVLGDAKSADRHFRLAAKTPTLYYALLAREALGMGNKPIHLAKASHSKADKARIASLELMQAVKLLKRGGAKRDLVSFVWPVARKIKSRASASAAASLFHDAGGPFLALRLAKAVGVYGFDIDNWAYPVRAMPRFKRIGYPVETAFIYGLSRQESEFNTTAGSSVGARGLMQLMPATAKRVARRHRVSHSTSKLKTHPSHNVMLGTALLGDLLKDFHGSYIMTMVGYNAGPRRATDWVARYGDPRGGRVDPIDWVESIPFTETRNYVQKVLQNIHVYRSRLAPRSMIGMSYDLQRGGTTGVVATGSIKKGSSCGKRKSIINLIQDCK